MNVLNDSKTMESLIPLAIFGLQELIKAAPGLYAELSTLFSKKTPPTDAEWAALLAKVTAKSYKDYVPATDLTDTDLGGVPPAPPETTAP